MTDLPRACKPRESVLSLPWNVTPESARPEKLSSLFNAWSPLDRTFSGGAADKEVLIYSSIVGLPRVNHDLESHVGKAVHPYSSDGLVRASHALWSQPG